MKERPILFSALMVQAIIAGRKTQTRRIVGHSSVDHSFGAADIVMDEKTFGLSNHEYFQWRDGEPGPSFFCPYGNPGDQLWVRENFIALGYWQCSVEKKTGKQEWHFVDETKRHSVNHGYEADGIHAELCRDRKTVGLHRWLRPSIFMPRDVSRIQLEITGVRVERLHDISETDAIAEGCKSRPSLFTAKKDYESLWKSINGDKSWTDNPWVWVVEFKVVQP